MVNGRNVYNKISALGYGAAVFFDEVNMHYISGFFSTDGFVLVTESETALVIDSRYFEAGIRAKNEGILGADVNVYLLDGSVMRILGEMLEKQNVTDVCYDSTRTTVARAKALSEFFAKLSFGGIEDICGEFRRVKTEKEIEAIKNAQSITDKAFAHVLNFIKKGVTEKQVAAELEYAMRRNGADGFAFETIAVSGANSSLPHGVPTDAPLTENAFLTMDFGARWGGYCSDMTRTVVLGKADDKTRHIYQTVLEAQKLGIAAAKAGADGKSIDAAARDYIYAQGYEGKFGHSLGHSLGLEIHESPRFSTRSTDVFVPGNIMTVEPGIYIEGFGGCRIEDMVLITAEGCENLTNSPKELIEL